MRIILIFFLLFMLTNCAVGPNYHVPCLPIPSHYVFSQHSNSSHKNDIAWWKCLDDPILINLIEKACTCNLDVVSASAKIRGARAAVNVANANFIPVLNSSGRLVRDHLSGNGELISNFQNFRIPLTYTDYKFGFDASWELDFFGHTRRTVEAACGRLQSAILNRDNVKIIVAAEVARTYILYRVNQKRLIIAKHTLDSYLKTMRLVKLQIRAGAATNVDLERIESEVFSAKAVLPQLQAEASANLIALAVLIGESPEKLYPCLAHYAPIPVINAKWLSVGLPSDLLLRRPDVRASERELAASTADIGVAVSDLFPRFQLIGDLGFDTVFPGTYFLPASRYWTIGPQFTAPIFQGGRLFATVRQREADAAVAFANYKKTVLEALADVEEALVRYDRERKRNKGLSASVMKLKKASNLIRLQYQEGQINLMNVLDVERQLDTLSDQYAQSTGAVETDLIALYKALGGGWDCC